MSDRLEITTATQLSPEEISAVLTVVEEATRADGAPPLNEAALLHLRRGHGAIEHLIAKGDGQIVGYAQRQDGAVPTGELVVSPVHRGQGIGTALLDALTGRGPVQVLAVGNRLAAQALARSHRARYRRTRWGDHPELPTAGGRGRLDRGERPRVRRPSRAMPYHATRSRGPDGGELVRSGRLLRRDLGRPDGRISLDKAARRSTGRGLRPRSGPPGRRTRPRQGVVGQRVTAPQTTREHPRPALRRGRPRGSNCLVLSLWFPCCQP